MKCFMSFLPLAVAMLDSVTASPIAKAQETALRTVHQFPNHTWIENFAFRPNDQIIATDISNSRVILVDPNCPESPQTLVQLAVNTTIAGITEVEDDVFYTQGIPGSDLYEFIFPPNKTVIYEIDMRPYATTRRAAVREVVHISEAVVLNGNCLLSKKDQTILMADSGAGVIYKLHVRTGEYEVVIDDPILKPVPGMTPAFGVNGVTIVGNELYFSSSNQATIGTFPIDEDGKATGPARVITTDAQNADDFAVDKQGNVWLAENVGNQVVKISKNGQIEVVAGGNGSTDVVGPVSARFGRSVVDRDTLYISTDGLVLDQTTGNALRSDGKIAAFDTRECSV